jgi:hypothetical protein
MNGFNWKLWGKGLIAAAIGGAVGSLTLAVADPSALSNPKALGLVAGVGAIKVTLAYLKNHPPVDVDPEPPTQKP